MPRKRKRSVSPPASAVGPAVRGDEGRNDMSIQQGPQSGRSNPRSHSSMISPRQHQRHSPPHYHNHAYSPPPYHQTHRNSPDREEHPLHSPSNPHAPSHYNFANRAYAQQRDSGFNTFRVNPGPVAGGSNPLPSVPPPIPSPLPTPSSEDSFHYRYRPHSHSQPPPAMTTPSTSIPPGSSYPRLSPPLEVEHEMGRSANGSGFRNTRGWGRNGGGEISLSSSDEEDVPYNPATAGGRSKVMVKYLIMKAKYRYVLDEHALLSDELESLRREEHEQYTLKEVGVDEIVKSFGSDSDRFLHDRNDQHAQQYQLHHDHDSADGDMDLLKDLDKERHAFLNRDRGINNNKDRERWDGGNDVPRGRDHHVDLDRNGSGGRQRQRSSSRSRAESTNIDSRSYHHQYHSYRRTPPPLPSISERQQQQQPTSSFSQQDTRQYIPERPDTFGQQEGGQQRYLPSPQQYSSQSHGRGLISPPSSQQRQNRYQSPPPPLPPHHQYRESQERRRNHEENFQSQSEPRDRTDQGRQGPAYASNTTFPVNDEQQPESEMRNIPSSSSSSSRPPRHSPRISHSSHSPTDADPHSNNRLYQPESSRERDTRPKRGRPSLEESARERDYENPMPSTSQRSRSRPRSERSVTPQPPPKQTQLDPVRSRSRTSSAASLLRPGQVGGTPPPLRNSSLAVTVNPTNSFSPSSTPHAVTRNNNNNTPTPPIRLSNDSPPSPPPHHRSATTHSPLTLQKDVTSIIKDERDLHVVEERDSHDSRRRGMDVDS